MSDTENKSEETVWHYTKLGSLDKILKERVHLRFTHINFLNDPSENLFLKEFIIKHKNEFIKILDDSDVIEMFKSSNVEHFIEKIKNDLNKDLREDFKKLSELDIKRFEPYTFSTSKSKDSMIFWNKEYAGLNGISIGFDPNKIIAGSKFKIKNIDDTKVFYISLDLENVKKIKHEIIKPILLYLAVIYKVISEEPKLSLTNPYTSLHYFIDKYSCYFKHESWKHEEEIRFIISDDILQHSKIEIEFNEDKISKRIYKDFDKSIVQSIMLGPNCSDAQVHAVESYLKEKQYDGVIVERSHAFDFMH